MTDAEVFGTTTAPPSAASGGMTDEEVFGTGLEKLPEEAFQAYYAQHPLALPPKQAATPVDPSAPPGPMAAPVGGEFGDLSAQPWAQGEPVPEGKVAPAAKIANAAVEGWRATPSLLTPEAQDVINKMGPLGQQLHQSRTASSRDRHSWPMEPSHERRRGRRVASGDGIVGW